MTGLLKEIRITIAFVLLFPFTCQSFETTGLNANSLTSFKGSAEQYFKTKQGMEQEFHEHEQQINSLDAKLKHCHRCPERDQIIATLDSLYLRVNN